MTEGKTIFGRWTKTWFVWALLLSTAALAQAETFEVGDQLPPFIMRDLEGQAHKLHDFFDGDADDPQLVVLDFWATHCAPCKAELPEIVKFAREHRGDGVKVLLVNYKEKDEDVRPFVLKNRIPLTILMDRGGLMSRRLGVLELPVMLILDRDGIIRDRQTGGIENVREHLEQVFRQVVKTSQPEK